MILGGNPVYNAPADLEFADAARQRRQDRRVHLGLYEDETSALCHWHVPEAHFLESWGDVRGLRRHGDDPAAADRPALRRQLGASSCSPRCWASATGPACEIVRDYWKEQGCPAETSRRPGGRPLHDGVVAETATAVEPKPVAAAKLDQVALAGRAAAERRSRSSSAPTRRSGTAGTPTTAGSRSCPSRSPS